MRPTATLLAALACAAPILAHAEERICSPSEHDSGDYQVRWSQGRHVELRGTRYAGRSIHWLDAGGWRTGGRHYWTAGFDDEGAHAFWVNEARYEYDPGHGRGGRLYHHIAKRPASPEATARLRQGRYDHPFPDSTPAEAPIPREAADGETTHSLSHADCAVVKDGSLRLASDYSIGDILTLYIRHALRPEEDRESANGLPSDPPMPPSER